MRHADRPAIVLVVWLCSWSSSLSCCGGSGSGRNSCDSRGSGDGRGGGGNVGVVNQVENNDKAENDKEESRLSNKQKTGD